MKFQQFALSFRRNSPSASMLLLSCLGFAQVGNGQTTTARTAESSAPTAQSNPLTAEVNQLLRQLHDPSFAVRESASLRLIEIGEPGLQSLRKAESSNSPDVAARVSRIAAEVERMVFEKRAKGFLISADPTEDFGLPGWTPFRAQVGSSRSSKLLFLEMIRRQKDLALAIDSVSKAAGTPNEQSAMDQMSITAAEIAQHFRTNMTYGGSLPGIGDAVGLLVACSMLQGQAPIEVNLTIVSAVYRAEVGDYFNKAGYGRCMRVLVGKWMPKTQEVLAADVLSLAMQKDIREGAVVARRHLGKQSDNDIRQFAFQCLSRFGESSDLALVSQHLNDQTIIHQYEESLPVNSDDIEVQNAAPPLGKLGILQPAKTLSVRINDLALATCMSIAKEDPLTAFPRFRSSPVIGFYVNSVACPSDEEGARAASIEAWLKRHGTRPLNSN
jgi:hypothetical protein